MHRDITIAIHQVTHLNSDLRCSYEKRVMEITRHLKYTAQFRMIYKKDLFCIIEAHVDADFARA